MSKARDVLNILESEDQFSFRNLVQDAIAKKKSSGYVFIKFREGGKHDYSKAEYTLNGTGDTWFRKLDNFPKGTKGYGLAVQSFKVTSRSPQTQGDYNVYKGTITFIPDGEEDSLDTGTVWLWVDKNYELDDVLAYINKNKGNWKP